MDLMYRDKFIGVYTKGRLELYHPTIEGELYFGDLKVVTGKELKTFITDRIISESRRDIDKFLDSIGLAVYDIHEIALVTRLVNPMDGFWLRGNKDETYSNYVIPKISQLFEENKLTEKNAMSSGGQNIKYFATHEDRFGVVKKRLTGLTYDTEAELAVYYLANLLGVDTCPVYRIDKDHTFSSFEYNFLNESIIHMRHALDNYNPNEDVYSQVVKAFPQIEEDMIRMLILDFVTAQDDRHMSNYALCNDHLYPLYDNGRSLFWEDRLEIIKDSLTDVKLYSKSFGNIGTYYDVLKTISEEKSKEGFSLGDLVNLEVSFDEIYNCYKKAGYPEDRLKLITEWTHLCLEEIKILDSGGLDKLFQAQEKNNKTNIHKSSIFTNSKEDKNNNKI